MLSLFKRDDLHKLFRDFFFSVTDLEILPHSFIYLYQYELMNIFIVFQF